MVDESDESNESGVSVRLAWTLAGWGYGVDRINSCSGGVKGGRDRRPYWKGGASVEDQSRSERKWWRLGGKASLQRIGV